MNPRDKSTIVGFQASSARKTGRASYFLLPGAPETKAPGHRPTATSGARAMDKKVKGWWADVS